MMGVAQRSTAVCRVLSVARRRRPNARLPRREQIRESVREAAALEFQSYDTLSGKVVRARLARVRSK